MDYLSEQEYQKIYNDCPIHCPAYAEYDDEGNPVPGTEEH